MHMEVCEPLSYGKARRKLEGDDTTQWKGEQQPGSQIPGAHIPLVCRVIVSYFTLCLCKGALDVVKLIEQCQGAQS